MVNIIVEDFKKTVSKYSSGIKKAPWFLGRHVFVMVLLLILLELAVVTALFYQYVFLPRTGSVEADEAPAVFKEKNYQSVLKEWSRRQETIETSAKETYNNPF